MFSVIVPVYNSAKTLDRCVQSVREQTNKDWELILVDDGSADNSWDIIKKYEGIDSRVRGIHQNNAGPGAARNTGIQSAKGEYAVFLDSDDYMDSEYLELLRAKTEHADMVFIDVVLADEKGQKIRDEKMSKYKCCNKDTLIRSMMTGKIPWGGCRKAVRIELLRENNIHYSTLSVGEEALYSFKLLEKTERVEFLDEKSVYVYVDHPGSQSTKGSDDPWGPVLDELSAYLSSDDERYKKYANTLNSLNIAATVISIDRMTRLYNGKELKNRIRQRLDKYRRQRDDRFGVDRDSLMLKAKVFIPFLEIGWAFPIVLCSRLRRAFAA